MGVVLFLTATARTGSQNSFSGNELCGLSPRADWSAFWHTAAIRPAVLLPAVNTSAPGCRGMKEGVPGCMYPASRLASQISELEIECVLC